MVRTYWFVPVFYEASGNLDLQPSARYDHVEACRPRAMCIYDGSATKRTVKALGGLNMDFQLLRKDEAFWRPSNQMRVENTDIARQLGAEEVGARLWRLKPGQASTLHRHRSQEEIYLVLEGTGRIKVGDETLTLAGGDFLRVAPETLRQVFNDTEADALWFVFGAPVEAANTLEMSEETLAWMYPRGPRALPEELGGGNFTP
jgi:uncharacterized cupin superfamily protein